MIRMSRIWADNFALIFPYPADQATGQATGQAEIRDRTAKILKFCEVPKSREEIMAFLNLTHRDYFMDEILKPLLDIGKRKRTESAPTSPNQKYVTLSDNKGAKWAKGALDGH